MFLEILSPEKTLFTGNVYGIILPGINGLFTILEHHANIIGALVEGKVQIIEDKDSLKKIEFKVKSGFVEVNNNKANIFVEEQI
ncbi:MAG: FoF1 ATP synthase subunit delta/epsilon [Chitinophagaceae bacterium]